MMKQERNAFFSQVPSSVIGASLLLLGSIDPKTLQPFDKVLARVSDESYTTWYADFVAEPAHAKNETPLILGVKEAKMVIPYNADTKHLVGTTYEAPEYYRYWED